MHKEFIRVDLAGEKGACYLYAGHVWTLALMGKDPSTELTHMYEQEVSHFILFQDLQKKYQVAPTLFMPLWRLLGWSLGAISSIKGESTAMECVAAVEQVILDHYYSQIQQLRRYPLKEADPLLPILEKCYEDEGRHHEVASEYAPRHPLFQKAVRTFTRIAITLSSLL